MANSSTPLGTKENPRSLLPDDLNARGPLLWWNQDVVKVGKGDGMALASAAWSHLDSLRTQQETWRWMQALNATLYHGGAIEAFVGAVGGMGAAVALWGQGMTLGGPLHNITREATDTVCARLALSKPKCTASSKNGTWDDRMKCEALTDFGSGLAQQTKLYEKLPRLDVDAAIFGDGILKPCVRDGKLCMERRLRPNFIIDEREGYTGDPRHIFETASETREGLAVLFPDGADVIARTMPTTSSDYFRPPVDDAYSTTVEYVEAWRLPLKPGDDGPLGMGRHIAFTRAGVICDEPYLGPGMPIIRLTWFPPTIGFWGESFVSAIRNGQLKLNRIDTIIDETMRRMSVGRWIALSGANIVTEWVNNEIGTIVRVDMPGGLQKDNEDAVPKELPGERMFEMTQQLAIAGVSPLASSGETPSGLKSGEAIKVHMDVQTQRFAPLEQRRGEFVVEHAVAGFQLVQRYIKGGKSYKVWTLDKFAQARVIDFGEVNLDSEAFHIQLSATSFMSDSPEDQIDQAVSLAQAGVLDPIEMTDILTFQDIRSVTMEKTAALRFVRWLVWKMVRDEKFFMAPQPTWDLVRGLSACRAQTQECIMGGAPSWAISKLVAWEQLAMAQLPPPLGTKQPPPMLAVPPGGPALAQPAAPPVSPMLPFRSAA